MVNLGGKKSCLAMKSSMFYLRFHSSVCRFSNQEEPSPITNESTPPLPCVSVSSSVLWRIKGGRNNPRREIKKIKVSEVAVRETNVQRMKNGRTCHKKQRERKKPSALSYPWYVVNLLLSFASRLVLVMNDSWQS